MFTWFDIIILIILGLSTLFGAYKGLTGIIIGIFSFISSILTAYIIYPYVSHVTDRYISDELLLGIVTSITSYVISLIIFSFVSFRLRSLFKNNNIFDKFLGMIAGFIRGGIICLILFMISIIFSSGSYIDANNAYDVTVKACKAKQPTWIKKSYFAEYLSTASNNILILIPKETLKSIKLHKKLDQNEIIENIKDTRKVEKSLGREDNIFDSKFESDPEIELENELNEW